LNADFWPKLGASRAAAWNGLDSELDPQQLLSDLLVKAAAAVRGQ
jgi:hypothetical protein